MPYRLKKMKYKKMTENPWTKHLKLYRIKFPKLSMTEAMKGASKTYKRM